MTRRKTTDTDAVAVLETSDAVMTITDTDAVAVTAVEGALEEAPRLRVVTRKRQLRCLLTVEEINEKARELAKAQQDIEAEDRRQKEIKSQLKGELEALERHRSSLASTVSSGYEYRDVVVQDTFDYVDVTVTTVRTDNGEQINVRTMTDDERQVPLPGMPHDDDTYDDED